VRPARARQPQNPGPTDKSFLLLLYKKEVLFFFEKKNQKTFVHAEARRTARAGRLTGVAAGALMDTA